MASRRVRIKGIANIPQRKRPVNESKNDEPVLAEAKNEALPQTHTSNLAPSEVPDVTSNAASALHQKPEKVCAETSALNKTCTVAVPDAPSNTPTNSSPRKRSFIQNDDPDFSNNSTNQEKHTEDLRAKTNNFDTEVIAGSEEIKLSPGKINSTTVRSEIKLPPKKAPLMRRRFKPTVSHTAINRTAQLKNVDNNRPLVEDINSNNILKEATPIDDVNPSLLNDEQVKSTAICAPDDEFAKPSAHLGVRTKSVQGSASEEAETEGACLNLKEVSFATSNGVLNTEDTNYKIKGVTRLPKPQYIDGTKSGSDTEYPPPSASPNKFLNRPRIKAIPRLGQRRTSFSIGSASESEDETRKTHSRNRNDSVCSVTSTCNDPQPIIENASQQKKEFSSVIQRKCRRTEQSRKLAEARRDFLMKFGNSKPDRQRLTMIDLIFYNPTTSPMSQKKKRNSDTMCSSASEVTIISEKDADDPDDPPKEPKSAEENAPAEASDEENTVPAPQIIIGVNGEIVIDEKSLVIENKETIKSREALKQSQVVDGDFDTNYGVYKRVKRSKDWSKSETLRFYKALNTIGTDFTLMCELFPNRNRRELKMKFKKEERMNRNLIDRAVMQPIQFDMTELRKDVAVEELEQLEAERRKQEREQYKLETVMKKQKRSRGSSLGSNEEERPPRKKRVKKMTTSQEFIKGGINSIVDSDSNCSVSTIQSVRTKPGDSGSEDDQMEEKTLNKIQTTRSGRISKPRNLVGVADNYSEEQEKSVASPNSVADCDGADTNADNDNLTIANGSDGEATEDENLSPGSIMILTEIDDAGQTIQKIYTVDESGKKVPIELSPDILQNLTQNASESLTGENDLGTDEQNDGVEFLESEIDQCVGNYLEHNGSIKLPLDTSLGNMSLPDVNFLTNLNNSDIIIGENSMVIPFDEFNSTILNE